jgi:drug/metabolite transporter (DMT)-like permease
LRLSIVWGGSFFTVGIAVQDLPPLTIAVARVGLAAIGLWLVHKNGGHLDAV